MPLIRPLAGIVLAGILVTANLSLAKQSEWNGTFSFASLKTYSNRILPNTVIPIELPSTGVPVLDNYFAFMVSFFYITLDPRNFRAHWQGNHLLGSLSSIWLVMLVEAHRPDGRGTGFTILTYVLEVVGELIGIGIGTPLWAILHLFLTSAPKGPAKVEKASLRALGWGVLLGHVVPTVAMLRLQPDGEGVWSQQIWTILRLFHPVYLAGFWTLFKNVQGRSSTMASPRRIYTFAMLASGFFHVTSLSYVLAPEMFPGWLNTTVTSALDPWTIFIPVPFWSEAVVKKVDLVTGVSIFLQWDYYCSAAAIFVWAAALYIEAGNSPLRKNSRGGLEMIGQTLLVAVLAGPAAGAAFLLQEREALFLLDADEGKKKQ